MTDLVTVADVELLSPSTYSVYKHTTKQIKEELGFDNSHIGKCCKRQRNVAYGYMWKYAEVS